MAIARSPEMVLSGYFLARRTGNASGNSTLPPPELQSPTWRHAYAMFFEKLGDGRTLNSFSNNLKGVRDHFDSHLDSGRIGWKAKSKDLTNGSPLPLRSTSLAVFNEWQDRTDAALWQAVQSFVETSVASVPSSLLDDIESEQEFGENNTRHSTTEGGRKIIISSRAERSPSLRNAAIAIHGSDCMICGFSYEAVYGEWGNGFIEVHHLIRIAEGERKTCPEKDLAVVCANCHRMLHRKGNTTLAIEELRLKLRVKFKIDNDNIQTNKVRRLT